MTGVLLLSSVDLLSTKNRPRATKVCAGAAWFDKIDPDWWERHGEDARVDLKRLDMGDAELCILGQLYGSFWTCLPMEMALGEIGRTCDDRIDPCSPEGWTVRDHVLATFAPLGLTLPYDATDGDYTRLTSTWRALIQGRRNQPQRSSP